jgi:rod shape-determining protein MreC
VLRDRRIYIWVLVLSVLVLLNLPVGGARVARAWVRDLFYPLENSLVAGGRRLSALFRSAGQTARLLAEKERLEQLVAERDFRIVEMEQIRLENEELRHQLGFAILSPRSLLLAEVTARGDMRGWWQTVRINKGHRDGVLPDMAVITSDGLVGRTMDVSRLSSEVLLITDPNSKVSCKVERNRALGIMRGAGARAGGPGAAELLASARPAQLTYLPSTHTIEPGDRVVTSGLGYVFPEGLPVGRVLMVRMHESGLYQQAEVQPFADLRALRHVFVILN